MATPRPGTVAWREEHGISSEVYEARGYVRYARGDVKLIEKYFGGFAPNQLRWAKGVAKRTSDEGGLIMPAYALPLSELRLRPIPPQLRPDNPLRKRRDPAHWHPAQLPPRGTEVLFEGKRVPEDRWSTAWVMRLHIASDPDHGKELAAELGYRTKDQISQLVSDPRCQGDLDRVLAEGNNPEPHQHQEWAKYLLPRVPERPLRHDHRHYADGAARRRHIDKYHSGREEDVIGWHVHDGMRFQEVMVEVTYEADPRASPGRRLDMLPLAWERLPAAEVVYFILEGKIKADSCLSAILDSNRSATALNVPSVGQWEAFELETFAELLRGKRVVVVVDSDADGNDNVMTQGLLLRARLERHDCLRVCLAAPPADDRVGIDEEDRFDKVGLDDHLGALGRTLDELR